MTRATPVVITNCTARKRARGPALTLGDGHGANCIASLARLWRSRRDQAAATHRVADLYAGRSFIEAKRAAARAGARLHVVSAGLGLVEADQAAPHYDLSASRSNSGLQHHLVRLGSTSGGWWIELNGCAPIAALVGKAPTGPVLLAIPSSYADMLIEDLDRLTAAQTQRLRVFTSARGIAALPGKLRASCMPYDDRLETLVGWSGTRSDFPQRALGHFVTELNGHLLSLPCSRDVVSRALDSLSPPERHTGTRLDDEALRRWLDKHWQACGGHTGKLLHRLRRIDGFACEQSRFAQACREYRANHVRAARETACAIA